MARLILKCPYFKSGRRKTRTHLSNMVKYIATRSGVEKTPQEEQTPSSTQKQKDAVNQILMDFPNTRNLFEYVDYNKNPTAENASEFISVALEQNLDRVGKRKNYIDYIANRPRVEKVGSHGLFTGGGDEIILCRIAEEVASHEGNVWTPIISLRREDAERIGYDNAESWHNLISYYAVEMAECLKIKPENFCWYGAFHNEGHHPHVHMVCYSVNPREGFLTKAGLAKMKSGLVKNVFEQELQQIYMEQSKSRDELKEESRMVLIQLIVDMKKGTVQNNMLEEKLAELAESLKSCKGKKQYGYLSPKMKVMVDGIVDELAKDPRINKAYMLWYEMRNEVLYNYRDKMPEPVTLSQQKEFKSIKNMIIREAERLGQQELGYTVKLQGGNESMDSKVVEGYKKPMIMNCGTRLLHHLSRVFGGQVPLKLWGTNKGIDSKLMRKLREKKVAQGHKRDDHEQNLVL